MLSCSSSYKFRNGRSQGIPKNLNNLRKGWISGQGWALDKSS